MSAVCYCLKVCMVFFAEQTNRKKANVVYYVRNVAFNGPAVLPENKIFFGFAFSESHHVILKFPVIHIFCLILAQVCQFVISVNGLNVLALDYRTVSKLILTGPRTVVMEVMEEKEADH